MKKDNKWIGFCRDVIYDDNFVKVACRSLGGEPIRAYHDPKITGELYTVFCTGDESELNECIKEPCDSQTQISLECNTCNKKLSDK